MTLSGLGVVFPWPEQVWHICGKRGAPKGDLSAHMDVNQPGLGGRLAVAADGCEGLAVFWEKVYANHRRYQPKRRLWQDYHQH